MLFTAYSLHPNEQISVNNDEREKNKNASTRDVCFFFTISNLQRREESIPIPRLAHLCIYAYIDSLKPITVLILTPVLESMLTAFH